MTPAPQELERKLQGKMARADALASTRGSLVEEMRVLRNMMQRQVGSFVRMLDVEPLDLKVVVKKIVHAGT